MKTTLGVPLSDVFKEKTVKYDSLFSSAVLHGSMESEIPLTAEEILQRHQAAERARHAEFIRKNYMENQGAVLRAIKGMLEEFAPHQLLLQSKSYQELESLLKKIEGLPPERSQLHAEAVRAQIEALMKQAELSQMQKVTYGIPKKP